MRCKICGFGASDICCIMQPVQKVEADMPCLFRAEPFDLVLREFRVEGKQRRNPKSILPPDPSPPCTKNAQNHQITRRPWSPLLLPELSPSTKEDVALSRFFDSSSFIPRHPETIRGYKEYLLSLYTAARAPTRLHQAVGSVSLAIVGAISEILEVVFLYELH